MVCLALDFQPTLSSIAPSKGLQVLLRPRLPLRAVVGLSGQQHGHDESKRIQHQSRQATLGTPLVPPLGHFLQTHFQFLRLCRSSENEVTAELLLSFSCVGVITRERVLPFLDFHATGSLDCSLDCST